MSDNINHPVHYNAHPSGVEAITVTEWMNFCVGNAMKYLWRAGLKGDTVEDLKKARWYIDREIARLERMSLPEVEAATREAKQSFERTCFNCTFAHHDPMRVTCRCCDDGLSGWAQQPEDHPLVDCEFDAKRSEG